MPDEVVQLAEAASRLVEADPGNRRAFRQLALALTMADVGVTTAAALGATAGLVGGPVAMPFLVAAAAAVLAERVADGRTRSAVLPSSEQELWEEAGASFAEDGLSTSLARSAAAYADLLSRSVDGDEAVAFRLGVDRSRVSQRLKAKTLYSFSDGESRRFPEWQFVEARTLPGLKDVLGVMDATLHPLVVDHWFTTPAVDLSIERAPTSPVLWLSTGGAVEPVSELAADL